MATYLLRAKIGMYSLDKGQRGCVTLLMKCVSTGRKLVGKCPTGKALLNYLFNANSIQRLWRRVTRDRESYDRDLFHRLLIPLLSAMLVFSKILRYSEGQFKVNNRTITVRSL